MPLQMAFHMRTPFTAGPLQKSFLRPCCCLSSCVYFQASNGKLLTFWNHPLSYILQKDHKCRFQQFQGPLNRWIVWLKKFQNTISSITLLTIPSSFKDTCLLANKHQFICSHLLMNDIVFWSFFTLTTHLFNGPWNCSNLHLRSFWPSSFCLMVVHAMHCKNKSRTLKLQEIFIAVFSAL